MKKIIIGLLICLLIGCTPSNKTSKSKHWINASGKTLETRIKAPSGYSRVHTDFARFLQTYPLKKNGSPILLYNGKKKWNQSSQVAVFKLPLENENLQQCADSVMRVYAEYYWHNQQYDKIQFHLSDGFLLSYSKWCEGYRVVFNNDHASYVKSASYDDSYDCFKKYLRIVFAYSGSASMVNESTPITPDKIQTGDVFLKGGSPGHVVMIVDVCTNKKRQKAFLLAQGYMPAQEFHVLKNPRHKDPWYYQNEIKYPFETPDYTFEEGSLRHLIY